MSDFPKFNSGEEFLQYMDQRVADIKAGRVTFPPYHAISFADRAAAEGSLAFHQQEATRLGFDADRVVMLMDPVSGDWVVLIPRDQDDAAFDEVW